MGKKSSIAFIVGGIVLVIVAIGTALAGGFDRDAASQPAAQPTVDSGGQGCCIFVHVNHGAIVKSESASVTEFDKKKFFLSYISSYLYVLYTKRYFSLLGMCECYL